MAQPNGPRRRYAAEDQPQRLRQQPVGYVISTAVNRLTKQPVEGQPDPMPVTAWDGKLRSLLGEERWQQYATDPRRRGVAGLITRAAREGRDVDKLLSEVVTMREFEKDPKSPARRVAGVLHYRIGQALAAPPTATLPAEVAGALSHATAPPGSRSQEQQARPDAAHDAPPPFRRNGRTPEGKDSR